LEEAVTDFRRVLADQGNFFPAWVDLGITEALRGNFTDARSVLERALAMDSRPAEVHFGLGLCALETGDYPRAIDAFQQTLTRNPQFPDAYNNLGVAYDRQGELPQAAECFRRAIGLHPDNAGALRNLADVLGRLGHSTDAAAATGAAEDPAMAIAIAVELETAGSPDRALEVLKAAARSQPQLADLHDAMGELLHRLGRLAEALDCYERALAIDETRVRTWIHSGNALESLGALTRAIENFEQGLSLDPANAQCLASLASCAYRLCDWALVDRMLAALRASETGIDALPAFLLLASDLEPGDIAQSQQRRARATRWPLPPERPPPAAGPRERLRVAYISPDFRTHPVGYAIAGVIERHDRRRISPIAISLKAADGSPIAARLKTAFDQFHDVTDRTDREVVRLIRDLEVDVAIDLAGLTTGARPAIFAMRAAPVQVSYLGYPGSTGMPFMDFLIADAHVVPTGDDGFYAERVVRLPGCYLPFDDRRILEEAAPSRHAAGLPASGFVFCAFTSPFKISRSAFTIWMDLLREVEGSVLWLRAVGAETANQLRNAAGDLGVDPARLLFATSLESMTAHLSRLRLADLYLDTLPYNAHTTAAEALWAGVPVVTCAGRYFAGRVGTSLLSACGLDDLICRGLDDYRALALGLARSPERLGAVRHRLRASRASAPAFDTARYTRDLEDLLFRLPGTQPPAHAHSPAVGST
jgi:predicted O-linked N-acetylglucosamine transferase (SPINDLY family)